MDFTIKKYLVFLKALQNEKCSFQTFQEFIENPKDKAIVLRHDVDKYPSFSLKFAQIQHELGIKGTYFFRIVPQSLQPNIIEEIAKLEHEIGYHYEDIDIAAKQIRRESGSRKLSGGNRELSEDLLAKKAVEFFEIHLEKLRKYYPVNTICMHGSPLSKYDNKLVWEYYNYRDFGIIGEPYYDVDFSKVLYLTDTGRRWDGDKVSVRDRIGSRESGVGNQEFKNTQDIIEAAQNNLLPPQIMFTFHPQRWTNHPYYWCKELVMQNAKNVVKRVIVKRDN